MSKKGKVYGFIGWAAALTGVAVAAVAIIKMLKDQSASVDEAIDDLIDFYNGKADELDRLVTETEIRIAN